MLSCGISHSSYNSDQALLTLDVIDQAVQMRFIRLIPSSPDSMVWLQPPCYFTMIVCGRFVRWTQVDKGKSGIDYDDVIAINFLRLAR